MKSVQSMKESVDENGGFALHTFSFIGYFMASPFLTFQSAK